MINHKKAFLLAAIMLAQSSVSAQNYKYNASDVIRYALTSHGITYLLRNKRGTLNRWKFNPSASSKIADGGSRVSSKLWGNTDCSGLAGAAFRYKKYYKPEQKKGHVLGTVHFADFSRRQKNGFYRVGKRSGIKKNVRHGDAINYTSSPYGHIFFFNGKMSNGKMRTVEAKGRKYGVGSMVRSFNSLSKKPWHIVRSKYVKNDVKNIKKFFPVSSASPKVTTLGKINSSRSAQVETETRTSSRRTRTTTTNTYKVRSGDHLGKIAKKLDISQSAIRKANPGVRWNRLQIGQKLNIPQATAATSRPARTSASFKSYRVKRGDSVGKIARRHGVSVKALKKANGMTKRNPIIHVGQTLKIPR